MMSPEQEQHLAAIKARAVARFDAKYRSGQAHHGGNLWDRPALVEAIHESTDLTTYLHCVEDHHKEIAACLAKASVEADSLPESPAKVEILELLGEAAGLLG